MGIRVFTQSSPPPLCADDDSFWVPCLITDPVQHDPVETDSILITHIAAVELYGNGERALKKKQAYCVGSITAKRLRDRGYERVSCLGDKASESIIPRNAIITWLRGDHYIRDFSIEPNVVPMQVYRSEVSSEALRRITSLGPDTLWIYSHKVLDAIESSLRTSGINLMCTDSCKPDLSAWKTISRFYPEIR